MKSNTSMNDRRDASVLGKFSARTRAILEAVIHGPLAEQAIAQFEAKEIENRRALLADLSRLDKAYGPEKKPTVVAAEQAARKLEAAEQALGDARVASAQAASASDAVDLRYGARRRVILDALMESADDRLAEFIRRAGTVKDSDLVVALEYWVDTAKGPMERVHRVNSNGVEVETARVVVGAAIDEARRLQLEPLGYAEVSEALRGLCARLAPALAPLTLNPPSLSAEHAEIGAPIKWCGSSQWVTDAPHEPTAADRATKAEDDKARLNKSRA